MLMCSFVANTLSTHARFLCPWNFPYNSSSTQQQYYVLLLACFSDGSDDKESACNAGDLSSIPGSGRFSGEGSDNPLWYSFLGNPMDREAWRGHSPWSHNELVTAERLTHTHTQTHTHTNTHTHTHTHMQQQQRSSVRALPTISSQESQDSRTRMQFCYLEP